MSRDIRIILGLQDISPHGFRCHGQAKTETRRCRNHIEQPRPHQATQLLNRIQRLDQVTRTTLGELADLVLCTRWHRTGRNAQVDELVSKWLTAIAREGEIRTPPVVTGLALALGDSGPLVLSRDSADNLNLRESMLRRARRTEPLDGMSRVGGEIEELGPAGARARAIPRSTLRDDGTIVLRHRPDEVTHMQDALLRTPEPLPHTPNGVADDMLHTQDEAPRTPDEPPRTQVEWRQPAQHLGRNPDEPRHNPDQLRQPAQQLRHNPDDPRQTQCTSWASQLLTLVMGRWSELCLSGISLIRFISDCL